jgi:hypothetical protein
MRHLVSIASFQNAATVTPSDTVGLTRTASALYIGVSGDVKVDLEGSGTAIVFKAVPVGFLPVRATKVYTVAEGGASSIIALW